MITRHSAKVRNLIFLFTLLLPLTTHDVASAAGEQCVLKPEADRMACYERMLDDIVRNQGSQQALATLEQLAANDREARIKAHPLAHHIGRFSYTHYNNFAQAFVRCNDAYASGCYHGVLEAHLSAMPNLAPGDVSAVCREVKDPSRPAFTHFLCVHGLGHGLTMYFKDDMFKALSYCDGLGDPLDKENCYGGVFMQNIVTFMAQDGGGHHGHEGHGGHKEPSVPRKYLDPQDQLYPCTVVEKKYLRSCYFMQSSGILALNGGNFAKTFFACQKAPAEFQDVCAQSIGRDISAFTVTDPAATKAICSLAAPPMIGECLRGAAKDFIYTHADPQRGIALCRLAEDGDKKGCYQGVREFLLDFYPDRAKRKEACRTADSGYQRMCRGAKWWLLWLN